MFKHGNTSYLMSRNRTTAESVMSTAKVGLKAANRRWIIIFLPELLETEIEKRLSIRPFVCAMQQDQMQFVAVAGAHNQNECATMRLHSLCCFRFASVLLRPSAINV